MSTNELEIKDAIEQAKNNDSLIAQNTKDKQDKIEELALIVKLQILLVFPKNSEEYKFVYQYFLKIKTIKTIEGSIKDHLIMLLNHKGALTLPLKQDKFSTLPNLLDKNTDSFQYAYCIKLLHDLAEKNKLDPLVVANLHSILKEKQGFNNPVTLTVTSILLQNHYVSLDIETKNKIKIAIRVFLSQVDAEPFEIPKDLILPLTRLRQFLHHSDQALRLEARGITEALRIPLELHDMLSLSIDGMQHTSEKAEDLVLVVGVSRSGKSTLINYLGGVEHDYVKDPATRKIYLPHKLGQKVLVKVGHSSASETLYPLIVQKAVTFKQIISVAAEEEDVTPEPEVDSTEAEADVKELTELFAYGDTPGFDDNRDEEEATCAALGVPLATYYAKKIRALVVVIPWDMTNPTSGESVKSFRLLCQTLGGILKDPRDLLQGKKEQSPVSLIFAISKPPRPEQGEFFDAEELRMQLKNRIKEIKSVKEKTYRDVKNKKEKLSTLEQSITHLTLCLGELAEFRSVDKKDSSVFGTALKYIASRLVNSKLVIAEGEKELVIKEQSNKWKSYMPQACIDRLELVLRKSFIATSENFSSADVIESYKYDWEKEKIRLEEEYNKLSRTVEETESEETILDLITQRSDNVFIIRGYKGTEEDTPDHCDDFLNYLTLLREKGLYITQEHFNFNASNKECKKVKEWAESFADELNKNLQGLLTLSDKIAAKDIAIQDIKKEIENKEALLKTTLIATEKEVKDEITKTIVDQKVAISNVEAAIEKLKKEKKELREKIDEIDNSPPIEYGSRLKIEKRSWFLGGLGSTSWTYEFSGKQPKITTKNQKRWVWDRVIGHYPDGYDLIPIDHIELSCTVDKGSKLVFRTAIPANSVMAGDDLSQHATTRPFGQEGVSSIQQIVPEQGSGLKQTGWFQIKGQNDLAQGKYSVNFYTKRGEDGYAGVRTFVLPKNIPSKRYEKEKLQSNIDEKKLEKKQKREELNRLQKDLKVHEEHLELMKKGLYDQQHKTSTIQNLLQELGYNGEDFLNKFFNKVKPHVEWLIKLGSYEILIKFLNCTKKQAEALGLEKQWLIGFIVGEDQSCDSSGTLSDVKFQTFLEEIPENFFKEMYEVAKTSGLALNSLRKIITSLNSSASGNSFPSYSMLPQKLKVQEVRRAGYQYLFESLKVLYLSHHLRIRTLTEVIKLLRLENDDTIAKYLTKLQNFEEKNIIKFCYPEIDKEILSDVINSLFTTSYSVVDAWEKCDSYGITMDYLRSTSGKAKADDDSQNSVNKFLIDISTKLYESVKKSDKQSCIKLLKDFFALGTNAEPVTFKPGKMREPLLFTLAEFGRTDWLKDPDIQPFLKWNTIDQQENTILHNAAFYGQNSFGEALIQKGVLVANTKGQYVWPKNKLGQTPFHMAAINGKVDLIIQWVEKYTAHNELLSKTSNGDSIVHLLVRHRQKEALGILMAKYPYLSVRNLNAYSQDPLYLAITNEDEQTAHQLLEYSVDLANRDVHGRTALHEAVRLDLLETIKNLLQKGADLRMTDNQGAIAEAYAPPNSKTHIHISNLTLEKRLIQHLKIETPTWRNLVFQGGGVKGFAYSSALSTLIEEGLCDPNFSQFTRVAGTSAGAITALLVGLGYNVEEIDHIIGIKALTKSDLPQVQFKDFLDGDWGAKLIAVKNQNWKELLGKDYHAVLERVRGIDGVLVGMARVLDGTAYQSIQAATQVYKEVERLYRELNQDFGLCPGEHLTNLFKQLIAIKLVAKTKDLSKDFATITFKELSQYGGFKSMYFVGVNTATGEPEVFSEETTPNMVIANAVRISMSIPGVFKPCHKVVKVNGKLEESKALYVDGGVLWNYPIDIFDFERYVDPQTSNPQLPRINKETLGLRLVPTKRKSYYEQDMKLEEENIATLWQHVQSLALTFVNNEENNHARQRNQFRTIYIDTLNVGTIDFERIDDISVKKALIEQGRQGVLTFRNRMSLSDYSKIELPSELHVISLQYSQGGNLGVKGKCVQLTDIKFRPHPQLVVAFYSYPDSRLQNLLHQNFGIPLWSRDENGHTAFHIAAESNQFQVLERLLKISPDGASAKNFKGEMPASLTEDKKVLALLMQYSTIENGSEMSMSSTADKKQIVEQHHIFADSISFLKSSFSSCTSLESVESSNTPMVLHQHQATTTISLVGTTSTSISDLDPSIVSSELNNEPIKSEKGKKQTVHIHT